MLEDGELFINENITQEVRAQFSIKEKSQLLFSHYNATAQEQVANLIFLIKSDNCYVFS